MFSINQSRRNTESEFVGANLFKSKESAQKYLFHLRGDVLAKPKEGLPLRYHTLIWVALACISLATILNYFPGQDTHIF